MEQSKPHLLQYLLVTFWYTAFGCYSAVFAYTPAADVTLLWPAAGVGYAAMLLYGYRIGISIAFGTLLVQLIAAPVPLIFLPFSILSNVLGTAAGYWLTQRAPFQPILGLKVRQGIGLLLGGLIAAVVGALVGALGLQTAEMIAPGEFAGSWLRWALGDLLGIIAIAPAAMLAVGWIRRRGLARTASGPAFASRPEMFSWLFAVLLLAIAIYQLSLASPTYALAMSFTPVALLCWAALRFLPVYAALANAFFSITVASTAGLGIGGFSPPINLIETGVLMVFLCAISLVPLLVMGATYETRWYANEIQRRASSDRLTGLLNRTAFEDAVSTALRVSTPGQSGLALIYLDLDQFKIVNDTAGHLAGDQLVLQLSHVLQSQVEAPEILARLGGDEFGLALSNLSEDQVLARAENIRYAIEAFRFAWQDRVFAVTASMGLAVQRTLQSDFRSLFSSADAACFTAKELGGNRVQLDAAGNDAFVERNQAMHWAVRLGEAVDNNRFHLYCQSIMPLSPGLPQGVHFEILLRMQEADGIIAPARFMPAAERFNLSVRIDRWVLENTLRWLAAHPVELAQTTLCSINLSPAAIADEQFPRLVRSLIDELKIPPNRLCFEITENVAIRDLSQARRFISALKKLGCVFALDDFGSGFCSFGYLKMLDVDFLKIDGSFVRELGRSPLDLSLVKSINDIGQTLGKRTVAEFVERAEVLREVLRLQVDYAQGFHIDRPTPIAEFFRTPRLRDSLLNAQ